MRRNSTTLNRSKTPSILSAPRAQRGEARVSVFRVLLVSLGVIIVSTLAIIIIAYSWKTFPNQMYKLVIAFVEVIFFGNIVGKLAARGFGRIYER